MDYAEQDGTPEVPATVGWGSIGAANQALIMNHYRNPRNRAPVAAPDIEATEVNPFCGDECTFRAHLTDGVISTVGTEGAGCSICQASLSLMSEAVRGMAPVGGAAPLDGLPAHDGRGDHGGDGVRPARRAGGAGLGPQLPRPRQVRVAGLVGPRSEP